MILSDPDQSEQGRVHQTALNGPSTFTLNSAAVRVNGTAPSPRLSQRECIKIDRVDLLQETPL